MLNAASSAAVLYAKPGDGHAAFRGGQRLVLVLFLLSAALWAVADFITVLLDTAGSSTPCQIGVIFAAAFDQLARFSVEQFLLWAVGDESGSSSSSSSGTRLPPAQLIPQVAVLARFLAGAVFIGFTRPQTDSFCVATTATPPVGILVAALDGAIVLLLLARAYSAGGIAKKESREGGGGQHSRARALMSVLLGLAIWTGVRVFPQTRGRS